MRLRQLKTRGAIIIRSGTIRLWPGKDARFFPLCLNACSNGLRGFAHIVSPQGILNGFAQCLAKPAHLIHTRTQ